MKRVVITGIGIVSCIGTDIEQIAMKLYGGVSGIGIDPQREGYGYRSPLVGVLPQMDLKGVLERKYRNTLPEAGEYAFIASQKAFEDGGMDNDFLNENEIGIIYGNDSSSYPVIETHERILKYGSTSLVGSGAVFKSMNSTITMNLATIFRLKGINFTLSAACASSSHAVGIATMMIRQGFQNVILCGGAQEVHHYSQASFDALGAFSTRTHDPQKASRPFDKDRDGLVPSGGAASLILEEYEHAKKRGAKIYGEIIGYGFSSNGVNISEPSKKGCEIAITRAIKDAGLTIKDIDYINAHATSTPQGDMHEAMALDTLFSEFSTPISSTKSMTGHECWMAGASEIVYTLLMMQRSFIAPNINFDHPDEFSEKLNIISEVKNQNLNICLSNSFGFGGTNSVVIFQKC